MFKRILAALCCITLIFAVGCDNNVVYDDLSNYESASDIENESLSVNPLTGEANISAEVATRRPVAIMIENSSVSMPVQTGVSKADVVYETEVEGGITRLMAVYQDITDMEKIGNVRSARYPYVDLALGHNAIYIHCGQDPTYCAPHLEDIDDISVDGKFDKKSEDGAQRFENGTKNTEHKLYVWANDLWSSINKKFNTEQKNAALWQDFTDEKLSLDGGSATSVSIPFPASTTRFTYDEASGLYTRLIQSTVQTDYFTKETTQVKNVFVLLTSISNYPDGKHRKVALESGDGYYITNGTVQFIKWSKGNSTNGFKFTDTEGNEIKVSVGNSWVCIANKSTCNPTIQ